MAVIRLWSHGPAMGIEGTCWQPVRHTDLTYQRLVFAFARVPLHVNAQTVIAYETEH